MSLVNAQNFSDGTKTVPTTAITEGTAKAWFQYDQQTPAVVASYNISSVTDVAQGQFDGNFTSSFDGVGGAVTTGCDQNATAAYNFINVIKVTAFTASKMQGITRPNTGADTKYDAKANRVAVHGDLA